MNILDKKYTNFYLYVASWSLYLLQGTIYEKGSIISQLLALFLIFVSALYSIKVHKYTSVPQYIKGLDVLLGMFVIYGVIHLIGSGDFVFLKDILLAFLPVYAFYYLGCKGVLTRKNMILSVLVFFVVATCYYFRIQQEALERIDGLTNRDTSSTTNNAAYLMLALLPSVLLFKKKPIFEFSLLIYCMFFILNGVKRGAIVIGTLVSLLIIRNSLNGTNSIKQKILISIAVAGAILGIFYYVEMLMSSNDFFQYRLAATLEGDTSERDVLYNHFWNIIKNEQDVFFYLFGRGADATIIDAGIKAHNDWLEIFFNQGVLGVFVYFIYWLKFYKQYRLLPTGSNSRLILGLLLLIFLLKTAFSMSYATFPVYAALLLGYSISGAEFCNIYEEK